MNIHDLKDYISKGGATLKPLDLTPADLVEGYMVSRLGGYMLKVEDNLLPSILLIIQSMQAKCTYYEYIGLWVNGGYLYLDYSANILDLDKALEYARSNDQLAIWDIANAKEIKINA
jgi:hypothetical protein